MGDGFVFLLLVAIVFKSVSILYQSKVEFAAWLLLLRFKCLFKIVQNISNILDPNT